MTPNVLAKYRAFVNSSLNTWLWCIFAVASWALFRYAMAGMEMLYKHTLHPASVMEGQLAFDGATIKTYYATMLSQGTLDKYLLVQVIDFAFMLTMFLAMVCMTIAAYRVLPRQKHLKTLAWFIALIAPLAPVFDALENLVSFIMLANPTDFSNWLALPYSTFAAIKYSLSFLGFSWTVVSVFIGLLAYLYINVNKLIASQLGAEK